MKNLLKSKVVVPSLAIISAIAASPSFAALSEQATAAQTSATSDAAAYVGMAWAITTVTTLGFFGIKQFRRAMGKA